MAAVILLVKSEQEHGANVKNLKSGPGARRGPLAGTYAYLMNQKETDKEVSRLNVEGLRLMILHRLNTLMPQGCKKCRKDHYLMVSEKPGVTCLRCDQPACKDCYTDYPGIDTWEYVCSPCKKVVKSDLGEGRLEPEKHIMAKYRMDMQPN